MNQSGLLHTEIDRWIVVWYYIEEYKLSRVFMKIKANIIVNKWTQEVKLYVALCLKLFGVL